MPSLDGNLDEYKQKSINMWIKTENVENYYNILHDNASITLKRKCHHFDEIFITGGTESCQNDNFQCRQWRKFRQNDDISVSV